MPGRANPIGLVFYGVFHPRRQGDKHIAKNLFLEVV